jgi:2-amino-4-hydroxy-6-hydroxymethyldihydropteridine diphosphokinase
LSAPELVVVALGSNLGDRRGHLHWAAGRLSEDLDSLRLSPLIETDPEGVPTPQPPYLNAVVAGLSTQPPRGLLDRLLQLELERHRERLGFRSPRTLDLDLILYGNRVISEPGLEIPHPRFRERRFVLEPLVHIEPELIDPVSGKTVRELLAQLG